MYYVFKQDVILAGDYAFFSEGPEGYDVTIWTAGKPLREDPPLVVIKSDEDKPTRLTDLLLTRFNMLIFSPKLVQAFEDLGIKNIDYYPVKIINHETGNIDESYKAAYIIGRIACLDMANSRYRYSADGSQTLMSLKKFRLLEEKIKSNSVIEGPPFIFRLDEFPAITIVEQSVKDRIEKEGITGVRFIDPATYVT